MLKFVFCHLFRDMLRGDCRRISLTKIKLNSRSHCSEKKAILKEQLSSQRKNMGEPVDALFRK